MRFWYWIFCLTGRDAVRGGTWLALSKTGRFSVVTNYQEPHEYMLHYDENGKPYVTSEMVDMKSRGDLVKDYVSGTMRGDEYLAKVREEGALYPGFCLIVGDNQGMYLYSNRDTTNSIDKIECGSTIGLTNTLLHPGWFKSERGVSLVNSLTVPNPDLLASLASDSDFRKTHGPPSAALVDLLAPTMAILADKVTPEYPSDSSTYDRAGQFSSIFVPAVNTSPNPQFVKEYGTRCSIAILVDEQNRATFYEHALDIDTKEWYDRVFHFTTQPIVTASDPTA